VPVSRAWHALRAFVPQSAAGAACEQQARGPGREGGGDDNLGAHRRGYENHTVIDDGMINRRGFLRLVGGAASAGLLAACDSEGEGLKGQQEVDSASSRGRLRARPDPAPPDATARAGLRPLGLGSTRDGLIYVPGGFGPGKRAPLALTLHGAGGDARSGISHFLHLADAAGVVLLAPESRGRTWDVLVGGYGPDVEFIDCALKWAFDRLALDTRRLAITGFSDGASYALSLGLTNGDLFTHLIAFSPGFMAPATRSRGKLPVFVSHGTRDRVLPIERCSRRIVPQLQHAGYRVRYREFDGPHTVPASIACEALRWFSSDERTTDVHAPRGTHV
jgi:phospholipase/carboxylesterase